MTTIETTLGDSLSLSHYRVRLSSVFSSDTIAADTAFSVSGLESFGSPYSKKKKEEGHKPNQVSKSSFSTSASTSEEKEEELWHKGKFRLSRTTCILDQIKTSFSPGLLRTTSKAPILGSWLFFKIVFVIFVHWQSPRHSYVICCSETWRPRRRASENQKFPSITEPERKRKRKREGERERGEE